MLFSVLKDELLGYYRKRINIFLTIVLLIFIILFSRLFMLQVVQYESLSGDANRNRTKKYEIIADRGFIYDKNMNILVSNTPTYDLVLNKDEIRKKDNINGMLDDIYKRLPFDRENVLKQLKDKDITKVLILRGLKLEDIAYFEEYSENFLGLSVELHSVRKYSDGLAYSHILGYVNEVTPEDIKNSNGFYKQGSQKGTMGVELKYEEELRGLNGSLYMERDAMGRIVNILNEKPSIPGNDVILTVDSDIQSYVHEIMKDKKGAVVVLDISDNSILSLYSAPSYDLNMFTPYLNEQEWVKIHRDKRSPLINRPIEGQYSPGSVYKVAMSLAGFEEKVVDARTQYYCSGTFRLNSYFSYRCWKRLGHGKMNMRTALAQSCDIYFYNLGLGLDIDRMEYYSKLLSLGERTGIDLPNEKTGILPSRKWKKAARGEIWYPGDTVNASIGQGYMTSTPLQIGVMMSGVFNGGKIYEPRVLKGIKYNDTGTIKFTEPVLKYQFDIPKETRDNIMLGLIDAVYKVGGTSRRAGLRDVIIGGKTGTAQVVSAKVTEKYGKGEEIPEEFRDHAWFTGVFPARDPKYVIVVLAENGGGGGSSAAPIGGQVITKMLDLGYFTKDPAVYRREVLKKK